MFRPKAVTAVVGTGFTVKTSNELFHDSPITDGSYDDNPLATPQTPCTPGSAFEPVSPPRIRRKRNSRDFNPFDSPAPANKFTSNPFDTPGKMSSNGTPCDTTHELSLPSNTSSLLTNEIAVKKQESSLQWGGRENGSQSLKSQIQMMKLSMPRSFKSSPKSAPVDLANLAVSTICLAPRLGAGIDQGRQPFERMKTSLMLNMHQECQGSESCDPPQGNTKKGKFHVAKLDHLLRNAVASHESCFAQKSQQTSIYARETATQLEAQNAIKSLTKNELGKRNLTCCKFLAGSYREIINDEKSKPTKDGLALMTVASSHYALGKYESALSIFQRAGIELKKKISSKPEYVIHCAKLFNNMGVCYFEMNNFEKAMLTFQRALHLFHDGAETNEIWIEAIADQTIILSNMAYLLIKCKQFDDASDLIDASFELLQILPDSKKSVMLVSTLSSMAFVYYRTRKYKASLDTYSACVQLQDKSYLYDESDQVELFLKMSDICKKQKDYEKRIYLLRCVLVYQQCYLSEDDEEIEETNNALAEAVQKFADAGGTNI